MTELLERALDAVRRLSPDAQDDIARAILALTKEQTIEDIDPTHLSDVLESVEQARNGEFATNTEIDAAFSRFRG